MELNGNSRLYEDIARASRPVYTAKRNLHQIERGGKKIYDLSQVSIFLFSFACGL
jgi:hypothetical protein